MADERLDIEISTTAKGDGARQARSDISSVKDEAHDAGAEVHSAGGKFKSFFGNLSKWFKDSAARAKSWSNKLKTSFKGALKAGKLAFREMRKAGLGLTVALAAAVKEGNDFRVAMSRVNTVVKDADIGEMSEQVLDLSANLGKATSELADGLYQALSAGVPEDNALSFLETATKAAIGGFTDVETAVDGLTTVLNAFNLDADETGRVADIMFTTVARGKTTFAELASSLALVAPIASSSGVGFDQLGAAIATLTANGTPTSQAMTQLRATILALNDVLGDGWSTTMSLQEGVKLLSEKAGGSQNKLRDMVGSVEALNGVLGLTGDNAASAAENLDAMQSSAGAMGDALDKADVVRHWPKLWNTIRAIVKEIGAVLDEKMAPVVNTITERLNQWRQSSGIFDTLADKLAGIRDTILGLWEAINQGQAKAVFTDIGQLLMSYIELGGLKAADAIANLAQDIGGRIGDYMVDKIKEYVLGGGPVGALVRFFGGGESEGPISTSISAAQTSTQARITAIQSRLQARIDEANSAVAAAADSVADSADALSGGAQAIRTGSDEIQDSVRYFIDGQETAGQAARDAFTGSARDWKAAVDKAVKSLDDVGTKVAAAGDQAAATVDERAAAAEKDFADAATKVTDATEEAGGKIVGGIDALGNSVADGFDNVARNTDRIIDLVNRQVDTITDLAVRVANAESRAASAQADAQLAQEQIENLR